MWNSMKGFGEVKKHNQISRAFVNVKIQAMCKKASTVRDETKP